MATWTDQLHNAFGNILAVAEAQKQKQTAVEYHIISKLSFSNM